MRRLPLLFFAAMDSEAARMVYGREPSAMQKRCKITRCVYEKGEDGRNVGDGLREETGARRRRAGKAHTRGSVAAKGRPPLWAQQWHAVTDYGQRYTSSVPGGCARASAALYKCLLCRKRHDDNRQDLSRMVLAHAGYCMFGASSAEEQLHTIL